jgi:HTH-type transcriptional regulator / antitoxin HipB
VSDPLLTPKHLGHILQTARKARKLSQAAVGARLGLSQKRISALELDPGGIAVDQLLKWCSVLGLELSLGAKPKLLPSGPDDSRAGTVEW